MKSIIVAILILMFQFSLFAEGRVVRILSHDRPPFHFKEESGEIVGICVDIVDTIFREMGLEYEISDNSWARVWHKVEHGEGEASFTTSRKKPREPFLYYPKTDMWTSEFVFFVLKENKHFAPGGSYKEVAESGKKVAIWRGASYNEPFWEHFPHKDGSTKYDPDKITQGAYNEQLYTVSGPVLALKMVGMDRISFCIEDRIVGLYFIRNYGITGDIIAYEKPLFSKGYPMAFIRNSDYPDLKKIADEFEKRLIDMKEDGRYDEIFRRWLSQ